MEIKSYSELRRAIKEIDNSDMKQKIIFGEDEDKCYVDTPIYPNMVKEISLWPGKYLLNVTTNG